MLQIKKNAGAADRNAGRISRRVVVVVVFLDGVRSKVNKVCCSVTIGQEWWAR